MATFLSILIIIICALLVLIVLIQNPKGGGIASNFMSTNTIIGAKQQVELIEQITWGFVGGLVVLCIAFTALGSGSPKVEQTNSIVGGAEMPMPGSSTMPGQQNPVQQTQPTTGAPAPANGAATTH